MSSAQGANARGCSSYGVLDRLLSVSLRVLAEARGTGPSARSGGAEDEEVEDEQKGDVILNPRSRSRGRQGPPSALAAPALLVRGLLSAVCAGRTLWQHLVDEHLHLQFVETLALGYLTLSLADKAAAAPCLVRVLDALRDYLSQGTQNILMFHRALLPVLAGVAPKTHPLAIEGGKGIRGGYTLIKEVGKLFALCFYSAIYYITK